ncbi:bifunctional serine/threonine-protein kinase/formylglycine-generating enzyme family protein [Geminocystis sp. CENA526]|uniref:bifunctional serine/threonine-protein kinase/formylglycine-generating enzyme family protein n=1 Tax=Geminocystis sp. CENA526 TaxID=1355871 RepID=UPI003D701B91
MNNQLLFKMLEGQNIDNKYYLKRLLGSGGFGGVYLADEVVRDRFIRELAVKLIITDNPDKQLDELIFSTTLKQQNLLDCYTCGECTLNNFEFLYLLMEKADYSLEDELKKGKLPEEKLKELVLDIAKGLDYLHRQNPVIVHRDLKPGNILKVGDKWKISDFGLVRSVQNNSTKTTTLMGSMGYAPPEAYEGKISPAWDMWSFGVVIYEALTGELPFNSETPLALMKEVVNKEVNVSQIPKFWQNIIEGCLSKENKKRFTITNLLENLENKININNGQKENIFTPLEITENIVNSSLEDAKTYFNSAEEYRKLKQYEKAINEQKEKILIPPKQEQYFTEDLGNGVTLDMVYIPAGSFMMGANQGEKGASNDEYPQHRVTLNAFYMAKYPITQAQYQAITGNNPSYFSNAKNAPLSKGGWLSKGHWGNHPVENVSWDMAQEFCQKLSQKTGQKYQLPSEAQWEYACRGGSTTKYYFGNNDNQLGDYAWYSQNSNNQTHAVGGKKPNQWGLYDMLGNVWEWCEDDYADNYQNTPTDGTSYINFSAKYKSMRGGSYYSYLINCHCAYRSRSTCTAIFDYVIGFRVVCNVSSGT